jgi:hypothetical protein
VGDPIEIGISVQGIAVGEGGVWVVNEAEDTLSRIAL